MKPITGETTFKEIRDLLEKEDKDFIAICKRIKEKKDISYNGPIYYFDFLMAVVLGGVSRSTQYQKNFLHKDCRGIELSTWSQNAMSFFIPNSNVLGEDIKDFLSGLDKNTELKAFQDGSWLKWKGKIFSNYLLKGNRNQNQVENKMKEMVNYLIQESRKIMLANLLSSNKQLIMNGAPGTGKTYSARNEIADELLGISNKSEKEKEEIKKIQLDMVQFHPSYDYTDFIDGIRPDLSVGNLSYTLKNGSFKSFCRRAGVVERIYAAGKSVDANTINDFLSGEDKEIKDFWKKKIEEDKLKKAIENTNLKTSEEQGEKDDEAMVDCLPKFLFIRR